MNRSLKLSMLVALALGGGQALALDLGQVQVKSALGQPLLAEIPLQPASPAELRNLTIQLASSEEFARAGITGGRTAIPLHFSVVNSGGRSVIRITSSAPVDDPYLDLLIEVNGSAGKSVREFAILLDPPGASPAPMAAAPAPSASRHVAVHERTTAATRPARAETSRPSSAPAAAGNGQYGPVARGQTLSAIARSTAPAGVDVQQMMLALKQANPDAFYRDNINALKSGQVLRVPTSTEANAMTIAAAVAEVRRQNSDWRAGTPGRPAVVADAATRDSSSSAPAHAAGIGSDRLSLVPAKDVKGANAQGGSAAGAGDKSAAGLHQDLLRTQESLASVQQQSNDLKTRLKDLTDINTKNEHLLSLKDNEIAELQAKLAAARKSAGQAAAAPAAVAAPASSTSAGPAVPSPPTGAVAAAGTTAAGTTPAAAATTSASPAATGTVAAASTAAGASVTPPAIATSTHAATPAATPATAPVAPPVAKPAPTHAAGHPASVAEQPWYMQTWAWAAAAGVVVLLLLLALLGRRRRSSGAGAASPGGRSASSLADRFGAPGDGPNLLGGDDVDQEELLDQLAEHPDDIGLHLELVTLYYSRRDVEHFEAAAEAMHAHITDPQQDEWQDVVHMGEDLVPGHPLFDHHVEPAHDESEAHQAFDIDDYAGDNDAPTVVSGMPPALPQSPKKVSEYSFNFDLTQPVVDPKRPGSAADDATVVAPVVAGRPAGTDAPETDEAESASSWQFDELNNPPAGQVNELGEFNDDPVDTKLDLARAYLDMGDAEGARAMLGEVMKEGSQMQRDAARRLLDGMH